MGLFDFIKPKSLATKGVKNSIPDSEKKYYRDDDYYTMKTYEGTPAEGTVITFEQRKKTTYPSSTGLYVAEILLLDYCAQGKYPHPKNGYPGFWWFEYGIRDVGAALYSLEDRGYIEMGSVTLAVNELSSTELKQLLQDKRQSTSGKKFDLINRVIDFYSDDELYDLGLEEKYILTSKGKAELYENQYVPYMHKNPNKTIEGSELEFTVWSINRLLGRSDKSNWKEVVDERYAAIKAIGDERMEAHLEFLRQNHPEDYSRIIARDRQLESIQRAADQYKKTHDLAAYTKFWEQLWSNGGVMFLGVKWNFELADLYIKAKRYNDALNFLNYLKKGRPEYEDRIEEYIEKIKRKQAASK